jgi:predicted transcriptional regulator
MLAKSNDCKYFTGLKYVSRLITNMAEDHFDQIAYLVSSSNRVTLLRTIADEPRRQAELSDQCDISRTTVHRAIENMAERGWITRDDGKYHLTFIGQALIDQYNEFETAFKAVNEKRPFFESFKGDIEIPASLLSQFELTETTPEDPHANMTVFSDAATHEIDHFCGVLPIASPAYNQIAREMFENGTEMELIIDQGALTANQSNYQDKLFEAMNADRFHLYVHPETLNLALATFDHETAMIAAMDEDKRVYAGLDGTTEEIVSWANSLFAKFREESQPLAELF